METGSRPCAGGVERPLTRIAHDYRLEDGGRVAMIAVRDGDPEPELSALVAALTAHPQAVLPLRLLFDLRDTQAAPDAEALKSVAMYLSSLHPRLDTRHAFVVRDELQFGLAHEIAGWAGTQGLQIRICRSVDDALGWLRPCAEP